MESNKNDKKELRNKFTDFEMKLMMTTGETLGGRDK